MIKMLLLNNQPINYFKFPGGEIQIRLPDLIVEERATLTWKPTNCEDIILLMMAVNALKNAGFYDILLDCLYLPYARQDRVCSKGEALSLQVICNLLDNLDFSYISFWDVHNEQKTFRYFEKTAVLNADRLDILKRFNLLEDFGCENLVICAPDAGALFQTQNLCIEFELPSPIYFRKTRNKKTGAIEVYDYQSGDRDLDQSDILIIDDICDGGRTFIEAAKILKDEASDIKLYLYVTHGIFSNGLDILLEHFEHIYCHHVLDDSRYQTNEKLTILRSFSDVRA